MMSFSISLPTKKIMLSINTTEIFTNVNTGLQALNFIEQDYKLLSRDLEKKISMINRLSLSRSFFKDGMEYMSYLNEVFSDDHHMNVWNDLESSTTAQIFARNGLSTPTKISSIVSEETFLRLVENAVVESEGSTSRLNHNIALIATGLGELKPYNDIVGLTKIPFSEQTRNCKDVLGQRVDEILPIFKLDGNLRIDSIGIGRISPPSIDIIDIPDFTSFQPDPDHIVHEDICLHPFEWRDSDFTHIVQSYFIASLERHVHCYKITEICEPNACPGDTISIKGDKFKFKGSNKKGSVSINSIELEIVSWDNELIQAKLPENITSGFIILDHPDSTIPPGLGNHPDAHTLKPFVPCLQTHNTFFSGGLSGIVDFRFTPDKNIIGCLRPGNEVTIWWKTTNLSALQLVVSGEGIDETIPIDSEQLPVGLTTYVIGDITTPIQQSIPIKISLQAEGYCSSGNMSLLVEQTFDVYNPTYDSSLSNESITQDLENWHRNIVQEQQVTIVPRSLRELINQVLYYESQDLKISAMGSLWSYTNCALSDTEPNPVMVDTSQLNRILSIDETPFSDYREDKRSNFDDSPVSSDNLIYVEGGAKIYEINVQLRRDSNPRAFRSLGGSNGQSLAGAINTSTHGSNIDVGPVSQAVRAIHLVSYGGQDWWIEPKTNSITVIDDIKISNQRCTKIIYDDDLFNSCLVSVGNGGVVYAYVIEVVPAYDLTLCTEKIDLTQARTVISSVVNEVYNNEWLEIITNGTKDCYLTYATRQEEPNIEFDLNSDPIDTDEDECPSAFEEALVNIFGLENSEAISDALAAPDAGPIGPAFITVSSISAAAGGIFTAIISPFIAHVGLKFAEASALLALFPIGGIFLFNERIIKEVDPILSSFEDIISAVTSALSTDESIRTQALIHLINAIWKLDLIVVDGKDVIDLIQTALTEAQRPAGCYRGPSDRAYSRQFINLDNLSTELEIQYIREKYAHDEIEKLVQSYEYVIDANCANDFLTELYALSDSARQENKAILVNIAIRFTQKSTAIMAMQQNELNAHFEIYLFKGLEGNDEFVERLYNLVSDFTVNGNKIYPHWGQLHEVAPSNFTELYNLNIWRDSLDQLKQEVLSDKNTFENEFATERGLILSS